MEKPSHARITLDQWRALLAVIDAGGYARAAEALGKSQSAVTYAIQQLESQLAIKVFRIEGRRAVPTPAGELLYRRARQLLDEAARIEAAACRLSAGIEAEVRLAADVLIPPALVLDALAAFAGRYPDTRVELIESVLSGTEDLLVRREVDLAIIGRVPPGFLGTPLCRVPMVAVSHPEHPLQQLGRELDVTDLRHHRQLVVRDSGLYRRRSEGWLGAEQRWTVSHMQTSVAAVRKGLGFAWLPLGYIAEDIETGRLRRLPLGEEGDRFVETYLVHGDREAAGEATACLAAILTEIIASDSGFS